MLEDATFQAWQDAPMGEPLSPEEQDLANEGLAAIEAGQVVRGDEVSAEIAARAAVQRAAG